MKDNNFTDQSKKLSLLESITNSLIGIFVGYFTQLLIFPLFNIHVNHSVNFKLTVIFFLTSLGRSYILRRTFNKIKAKKIIK